jgi:hypothetical protein
MRVCNFRLLQKKAFVEHEGKQYDRKEKKLAGKLANANKCPTLIMLRRMRSEMCYESRRVWL